METRNLKNKKLVFFDLDGTLTPSKSPIEPNMVNALCKLLQQKKVDVIGGGSDKQFFNQFLSHFDCPKETLENMVIMPTSGARMYTYDTGSDKWVKKYENNLSALEKEKILASLNQALKDVGYIPPEKIYGEAIEDRESQITFSANGQEAPLEIKSKWDPERKKRGPIVEKLKLYLPEFDIKMGGTNTIDITKKGVNKAYGVLEALKYMNLRLEDAVYIGDALYENGNDAIVKTTGIDTVQVAGPDQTREIIEEMLEY